MKFLLEHKSFDFIDKSKEIHGDKFDYSLVDFKNNKTQVDIICPVHGVFKQYPFVHLKGYGCRKCSNEDKKIYNTESFIKKSNEIHKNKYTYDKLEYKNVKSDIIITCPIHGDFKQVAREHLSGKGCEKCSKTFKLTNETFIEKAKHIHGDNYDYSLIDYKNNKIPIEIICKKHGRFFQRPDSHLNGKGCPICNESKGEKRVAKYLDNNFIKYVREYKFDDCKNKRKLPFDFYLSDYHSCIEFDGMQHFEAYYGQIQFEKTIFNDKIKNEYCKDNNIRLLRIKYNENVNEKLIQFLIDLELPGQEL